MKILSIILAILLIIGIVIFFGYQVAKLISLIKDRKRNRNIDENNNKEV